MQNSTTKSGLDADTAKLFAVELPRQYNEFLSESELRDHPHLRKCWAVAFLKGNDLSRTWMPVDDVPSRDGFYLVRTGSTEERPSRCTVAYFRSHNLDPWVLKVREGLIVLNDVTGWQPLPNMDEEGSTPEKINYAHYFGSNSSLNRLGKFLNDSTFVRGSFSNGDDWRVLPKGPGWIFEYGVSSVTVSTLLSGLKWLLGRKRESERDERKRLKGLKSD